MPKKRKTRKRTKRGGEDNEPCKGIPGRDKLGMCFLYKTKSRCHAPDRNRRSRWYKKPLCKWEEPSTLPTGDASAKLTTLEMPEEEEPSTLPTGDASAGLTTLEMPENEEPLPPTDEELYMKAIMMGPTAGAKACRYDIFPNWQKNAEEKKKMYECRKRVMASRNDKELQAKIRKMNAKPPANQTKEQAIEIMQNAKSISKCYDINRYYEDIRKQCREEMPARLKAQTQAMVDEVMKEGGRKRKSRKKRKKRKSRGGKRRKSRRKSRKRRKKRKTKKRR